MTSGQIQIPSLKFSHLPALADFILKNRLEKFARTYVGMIKEHQLPLLKYLVFMSDEQLMASGKQSAQELLTAFVKNEIKEHLKKGIERWIKNEIPGISRDKIQASDINILNYIIKQIFLNFITDFTTNPDQIINLVKELDQYYFAAETLSTDTFINILKEDLAVNLDFIEKIAFTSPGILYVYDLNEKKQIYNNKKMEAILGYTPEELFRLEGRKGVVHPEDIPVLEEYDDHFLNNGSEPFPIEYRVKDKWGKYRWMRAYETAFKRDDAGKIIQKIGFAIDIDNEKKFKDTLAFHEEQLLEAQEVAQMGSFIWDLNNRENTSMTPQLLNIFEMTGVGKMEDFLLKIHPADRPKVESAIKKSFETGQYECEYRYMSNKGEKVLWSRGVITYQDGKPANMKGTVMDVTHRHHMVQRLERSEELYKQAQAMALIGNSVWDLINDTITWSDELYRIYGLEPQKDKINYETIFSFIHPDDLEIVRENTRQALEKGNSYDFYFRIILKNGEIKTLHTKGEVKDEKGKPFKLLGTVQDVSRQKRTEKMLHDNQLLIQKIADTAPSIIAAYNINTGKYIFVNKAVEQLLGYSSQAILNEGTQYFSSRIHPDDLEMLIQQNQEAIMKANEQELGNAEMVIEFKYRMRHETTGEYKWFHTYGTIFERDELGKVKMVLNISVDISEIVKAERTLSQKNFELEKSNANLEEFAYVASHDLQEPLRKIKIFGDRLSERSREVLDETAALYLDKILNATERMSRLIKDLLDYSRLSRPNEQFTKTNLNEILQHVLTDFELLTVQKRASIEADTLPEIEAIPLQMTQLLNNLLSNSLKFSVPDRPPVIKITSQKPNARELTKLGLDHTLEWYKISVSDNGIGFNPEFSEKIFMIFQRLNGVHEYPGTGIGLTLCRKIAHNHKGTIIALGEENKGAEFQVYLPATQI